MNIHLVRDEKEKASRGYLCKARELYNYGKYQAALNAYNKVSLCAVRPQAQMT